MNLTEARKKFPVGSRVRVVDSGECYSSYDSWARLYLVSDDYNDWARSGIYLVDGDIGEVIRIGEHSDGFGNIAAIRVLDKKIFLIGIDGIEPYDPTSDGAVIPQDEVVFDTGLTTFQSNSGYKVSFSGTNLIVTAHGETVSYNVEELLDEIADKCYQKSRKIKAGDTVKIVNGEDSYPCYIDWLKENLTFEQALRFDWENTPRTGDYAMVVAISAHLDVNKDLYLIEVEHDDVSRLYLANREAIEKI